MLRGGALTLKLPHQLRPIRGAQSLAVRHQIGRVLASRRRLSLALRLLLREPLRFFGGFALRSRHLRRRLR